MLGDEVRAGMSRHGHSAGTAPRETRAGAGRSGDAADRQTARLMSLHGAADYLGVSYWTLRDLVNAGTIPRVRLPIGGTRDLRRVLVDREDLDRLIVTSK
jgi:excisionase family DNA binding protein